MEVDAAAVFNAMPLAPSGHRDILRIDPPPVLGPDVLPLVALGAARFERLAHWWAEAVDGGDDARIHGPSGVADFGIDVLARRPNGRYWAYQCKCVTRFKVAQLGKAVEEFVTHSVADVERFIVLVACEGSDVGLEPELRRLQQQHPHVILRVLYQGNLSNELRSHPDQVASMLGVEWARAFCGTAALETAQKRAGRHDRTMISGLVPPLADSFQLRPEAQQLLQAEGTASVLFGSGGVGKTQVAAYVARTLWESSAIDLRVWVNALSRDAIIDGYAQAAERVGQTGEHGTDADARSFLEWLDSTSKRWLVVLDDLTDPADMKGLWPPQSTRGRVIVTTRRRDAALSGAGRERTELSLFTAEEASAYVRSKLKEHPHLANDVVGVVDDLGRMPLALAQATAYMIDEGLSCAEYRNRFADLTSPLDRLVPEPGSLPDEYQRTLGKTWTLSVDAADLREPQGMASRMLTLASLLDPAGIPVQALTSTAARTWLKQGRGRVTAEQVRQAVQCLHRFSLATHDQGGAASMVRIHALVQRSTRDRATTASLNRAAIAAADSLCEIWPEVEDDRMFGQLLRDNASTLAAARPNPLWTKEGPHPLLVQIGDSLDEASHWQAASEHFREIRATAEDRLGPDHLAVLTIRGRSAFAVGHTDNLQESAEELEVLARDYERILGPDHHDTLSARSSHAYRAGDVSAEAAVVLFEGLLADCLRVLGRDDLLTLDTRQELARWRGIAGDPEGARGESEAALNDVLHVYGPDHEATIGARHNLAAWKGEAGDTVGALADFQELLVDAIPLIGRYSSNGIDIRFEIAELSGKAYGPAEAVNSFQELVADFTQTFGDDHHYTKMAREHLSKWESTEQPSS